MKIRSIPPANRHGNATINRGGIARISLVRADLKSKKASNKEENWKPHTIKKLNKSPTISIEEIKSKIKEQRQWWKDEIARLLEEFKPEQISSLLNEIKNML